MNQSIQEWEKEFEKKFIKEPMWELVPNTPRKIMASDEKVAELMVNIKSFIREAIIQAREEARMEAQDNCIKTIQEMRYEK